MDVNERESVLVARIANAIGESARTRMLLSLLDGRARTSTELAMVAEVSPSTSSVHLARLLADGLVKVLAQGKHRYYSLEGPNVARALEALSMIAGQTGKEFLPNTPDELRYARTCYDHIAGTVGVRFHNRLKQLGLLTADPKNDGEYDLSAEGTKVMERLGISVDSTRALRRRFAYGCLDWSERQPHIGGALGAAILQTALKKKWVEKDSYNRALNITKFGKQEMLLRFGIQL